MGKYKAAIKTKRIADHSHWIEGYDTYGEASMAIMEAMDAYVTTCKDGISDMFDCSMGSFSVYDVAAFEVWKLDWREKALSPSDLYVDDPEDSL